MTEKVEVQFGANTSDLDRGSQKAKQDIGEVGKSVQGLKGVLSEVKAAFAGIFNPAGMEQGQSRIRLTLSSLGQLHTSLRETLPAIAAVGEALVAAFVVEKIAEFIHKIIEFGEAMADLVVKTTQTAQMLGMTVEEVSRWNAVAMMSNMSSEQMRSSFTRLERAMVLATNGGRMQSAMFRQLHIDVTNLRSPTEALLEISDRFHNMADGPRKIAIAMALMGRAGAQNIPILNQGREALQRMFKESDYYGATMTASMVRAGLAVHESMDRMKLATQGFRNALFEALAPAIITVVDGLTSFIHSMTESYRTGGLIRTMCNTLMGLFRVLASVAVVMGAAIIGAFYAVKAAVEVVIDSVIALGQALYNLATGNYNHIADGFHAMAHDVAQDINNIADTARGARDALGSIWGTHAGGAPPASPSSDMDMGIPGMHGGGHHGGHHRRDNSAMEAWTEEMKFRQEMAHDDMQEQLRIQDQIVQRTGEYYGTDSKNYMSALRDRARMHYQYGQQVLREEMDAVEATTANQLAGINHNREIQGIRLADHRAHLQEMRGLGRISERQEIQGLRAIAEEENAIEEEHQNTLYQYRLQGYRDELALQNLTRADRMRINREIEALEEEHADRMSTIARQHATEINRINAQMLQATVNRWKGIVEPITGAMNGIFNNMLQGTQSFRASMVQALNSIVATFAQKGFEMLANWISVELAKTTTTAAGVTARVAAETAGATATTGISASSALVQIAHSAAVAAARVYAAIAAIPVVGPFLAPAMAVAALAAVIALGAKIAHAAGGFDIPSGTNPITQLHEEEMVLPKNIANPLRQALRGASPRLSTLGPTQGPSLPSALSEMALRGSERGGDHFHVHAMDVRGLEDFLRRNKRVFAQHIRAGARDGLGG